MRLVALIIALTAAQGACAKDFIGTNAPTFDTAPAQERSPDYATGLIVPPGWENERAPVEPVKAPKAELPKKFSWQGKITPIKNQGSCGSCWAFSAQATIADVLALHGKGALDLSEQFMVSCDESSSGCGGGWYHSAFALVKSEGDVLESAFPYRGQDLRCPASLPRVYKIAGYKALSRGVADTEQMKQAIYQYGPLSVAVSATGAFTRYKSGIYNESASGAINHAVNIVGWDETVNPPHWIMRNSWGTGWGENGFMRIAYGSRKIGYAAAYVDIFGPVPHNNPQPTPTPSPGPQPTPCPECRPCTFWRWIASFLAL